MDNDTYKQSNDVAEKINGLIEKIVEEIQKQYPHQWEEISKDLLTRGNSHLCSPSIKKMYEELRTMEEQFETPMMKMVRITQENLNKKE